MVNPAAGLPANHGKQSINGNPLPNSPKNKVSRTLMIFVFDQGDLTLSGTYLWRDKQTGAIFDNTFWTAPSGIRSTCRRLGAARATGTKSSSTEGTCLTGSDIPRAPTAYQDGSAGSAGYAAPTYTVNPPATYGMELHYKFLGRPERTKA